MHKKTHRYMEERTRLSILMCKKQKHFRIYCHILYTLQMHIFVKTLTHEWQNTKSMHSTLFISSSWVGRFDLQLHIHCVLIKFFFFPTSLHKNKEHLAKTKETELKNEEKKSVARTMKMVQLKIFRNGTTEKINLKFRKSL